MVTISEALRQLKEENNIENIILENKADDIYNQYYSNMERADFDAIWEADPTSTPDVRGKFVQWLLNRHRKGDNVLGQLPRIKKALTAYIADKNKFNTALGTADINGLELEKFLSTVEGTDKTAFRQALEQTGNVVTVASSKEYDVFHPLNWEGNSAIVGKPTPTSAEHDLNWCTGYASDNRYFRNYGGDYYCFIWKADRKNKDKCFQINIRPNHSDPGHSDIEYFLDGHDATPPNGGDNAQEQFLIFLLSQPDLVEELKGTVLEQKSKTVRDALEIQAAWKSDDAIVEYGGEYLFPLKHKYLRGVIKTVNVKDGVRDIRPKVFASCSQLKTVNLPSSVETIGVQAFSQCTSLDKINFSEGLKEIRALAFFGDSALKRVDIPDSLEYLDVSSFKDCPNVVLRINNLDGRRYIEVGDKLSDDDYRWLRKHVKQIRQ